MEKFTIGEIRGIVEDFNTLKENEDKGLDINECVKQIKNEELRDILSQSINTSDGEKAKKDFNDKIASRIDLSNLLTEETKDELIFIIKLFDEWNASYNIKEPMRMIDLVKEEPKIVQMVWANTDKEVQKEKIEEVVIDLVKENSAAVEIVWANTDKEVQKEKIEEVIDQVKENLYAVASVWTNTDKEVQKEKIEEVIERVKENPWVVGIVWANTDKEVQKKAVEKNPKLLSTVIDRVKENPWVVGIVWANTDKEVQKKAVEKNPKLLSTVIDRVKENPDAVAEVWAGTDKEVQKEALKENPKLLSKVIDLVKDDSEGVVKVLANTDKEVQKEKIEEVIDLVKENSLAVAEVWANTDKEVQKEKIVEVIDRVKENLYAVASVWDRTDKEVQGKNKKIFKQLIKLVDSESLKEILIRTNPDCILEEITDISKKILNKTNISQDYEEKIKMLYEKNEKIFKTLDFRFLDKAIEEGYTDEQILRITNYPEIQNYILQSGNNIIMNSAIKYMICNDSNWVLSLEKIRSNGNAYPELLSRLDSDIKEEDLDDKFMQNFLLIISDNRNYFDIKNVEDVRNYINIKDNVCKNILNGEIENIPESLKTYSKEQLYKFALLEYKFGIDFKEAEFLISRYGTDAEKIFEKTPESLEAKYLCSLKLIMECDNIEEVVEELKEKNEMEKPWLGFPNARNAEGQIINMFAELYNETLYKPRQEDKISMEETYIDKDGKEHKIEVYNINGNFDMNIRVEGAYRDFIEPDNFVDYYNQPNIDNHGNCESYIGNDLIASARNNGEGVMVGYSVIRKNSLTVSGPTDLRTGNMRFSIYREGQYVKFLTPKEMKDNTRHPHNEMVKDRIVIDENGNVTRYKPNYAVWIEETTEEERKQPGWDEEREKNLQWIRTKKLASQLGIPIVVIDREHFAKREMQKIELMQKLLSDEKIDMEEYGEYLGEYQDMPRTELIKEIITKFENNRVGIQYNRKLHDKYFTQQQCEKMVGQIQKYIDEQGNQEKEEMYESLAEIIQKEQEQIEVYGTDEMKKEKEMMKNYYESINKQFRESLENLRKKEPYEKEREIKGREKLFEYMGKITETDLYEENKQHSIEHIQKVMLFSQVLAEGEGISEKDKTLLLVAAALHDSGRKGLGEGNIPHAELSAKKAGEILKDTNEYGEFSDEEIAMVQTAISYHEHREKEKGKVDSNEIYKLAGEYGVNLNNNNNLERTVKLCTLLKDADALDRFRFAGRWKLNPEYLCCKTAKKESTINYAREVNERVAIEILKGVYGIDDIEEGNAVGELKRIREQKRIEEPHIELENIYRDTLIIDEKPQNVRRKKVRKKVRKILERCYIEEETTREDLLYEREKLGLDVKQKEERTEEKQDFQVKIDDEKTNVL